MATGTISPRTVVIDIATGRFTRDGFAYLQSLRETVSGTTGGNIDDLLTQQALLPPTGATLNDTERAEFMATISSMAGTIEALRRRVEDLEHEVLL